MYLLTLYGFIIIYKVIIKKVGIYENNIRKDGTVSIWIFEQYFSKNIEDLPILNTYF